MRTNGLLTLSAFCPFLFATGQTVDPPAIFRADAKLALVRFQVIANGADLVADLTKDEIELREDGAPRNIVLFEGGRLYPRLSKTEIHLLFDCSGSIQRARVLNPRVFSAALLDEFPNVSIGVWAFSGDTLSRFTSPTRDSAALRSGMDEVLRMPPDYTPLYRSLVGVARQLAAAPGDAVRLIVVVSDGKATPEPVKDDDAIAAARSAGIPIFPVQVNVRAEFDPHRSPFLSLAEATGGRAFTFKGKSPRNLLDQVLTRMAGEIRHEYVVGYSPPASATPARHSVQVVLKDPSRGRIAGGVRDVEY